MECASPSGTEKRVQSNANLAKACGEEPHYGAHLPPAGVGSSPLRVIRECDEELHGARDHAGMPPPALPDRILAQRHKHYLHYNPPPPPAHASPPKPQCIPQASL